MVDPLQTAVDTYWQQIKKLKRSEAWLEKRNVINLLRQRDLIQTIIECKNTSSASSRFPAELLLTLSDADEVVGRWNDNLAGMEDLPNWRRSLAPPEHHWWWYPQVESPQPWREVVMSSVTIALLTLCLALARDISARFLTGALGFWSSVGVVVPTVIAVFATGGALTKVGKELFETILAKRWKSSRDWSRVKFILALLLTGLFLLFHSAGLPWSADKFFVAGKERYEAGELASAQDNLNRALQLNSDIPLANHYLGLIYEDLRDFSKAKSEYTKAVEAGYIDSANNLAKLQITEDENPESAAVLLLSVLRDKGLQAEPELEYSLHKNLGWAWVEQGNRLEEAEGVLVIANRLEEELEDSRPDSYCLLAQVYEELDRDNDALIQWKTCLRKISRPEDDAWKGLVNQGLANSDVDDSSLETEP